MSNEKSIDRSAAELSATMAASVHKQTLHFADGSSVEIVGVPAITQAKWNPAPLVAVSDNKLPDFPKPEITSYQHDSVRTMVIESYSTSQMLSYGAQCFTAGQVAPQAPVEPLTDRKIDQMFCSIVGMASKEELVCIRQFARNLLATPPTSKADTGEAIRNAALEEAAQVCLENCRAGNPDTARHAALLFSANRIRALKSATPSTIKAEPITMFGIGCCDNPEVCDLHASGQCLMQDKSEPTGEQL